MEIGDMRVATGGATQGMTEKNEAGPKAEFLETFHRLPDARFRTSATGLKVATIAEGSGTAITKGAQVKMRYTGWLENGSKFDSSEEKGQPFEFTVGMGRVIQGWDEGTLGMKPGERRQLVIPASLAYGSRQVGKIPPNATLIFNIEAESVTAPPSNPKGTMSVMA